MRICLGHTCSNALLGSVHGSTQWPEANVNLLANSRHACESAAATAYMQLKHSSARGVIVHLRRRFE